MRIFVNIIVLLSMSAAGCTTDTRLEPAPLTRTVNGNLAVERIRGVRVTADAGTWPGIAAISEQVTPIKVTIDNGHPYAMRIRFRDFTLVGGSGRQYAALPPYRIEGSVEAEIISAHYGVFPTPRSRYNGFHAAPPYDAIYPQWPSTHRTFYYDTVYADRYYDRWGTVDMPTPRMLAEALIEGDIEPGGSASGFVYFEPFVEESVVAFQLNLVHAHDETVFGTARLDFRVLR
jgi:hypothetical protein